MPGWTLADCISGTTQALGNRTSLSTSAVSRWANIALEQLWWTIPHKEREAIALSSTTSGENRITLPSDFGDLIAFSNTSSSPPTLLRQIQPDDVDSASTARGRPTSFVLWDDYVELYPNPDSAYSLQLRYNNTFTELSASTASMSIDTRWGLAWQYRTTELLATHLQDWEVAATYRQLYMEQAATIPSDLALRQRPQEGRAVSWMTRGRGVSRLDFDQRSWE